MSSRIKQREEARAKREAEEQAQQQANKRRQQMWLLGGIALVAVIVVVAVISLSSGGKNDGGNPDKIQGKADIQAMLTGIGQQGQALGKATAPVTLVEFADLQCPFCKEYADNVVPRLVQDYVRTGKLRMVFQPLTFIGPDSERAARVALASGRQGKLWNYTELFYRNQGSEGTGYATDAFLRSIGAAIPGLDVDAAFSARDDASVTRALASAQAQADRAGISSTPSFLIGRTGQAAKPLTVSKLEAGAFTSEIDKLLGGQ